MIEIVIVVAILGIVAAVATPTLRAVMRRNLVNRTARHTVARLAKARSLAASGKNNVTNSQGITWDATDRTRGSGIRILSTTSYLVFVDRDSVTDNDEITVETVSLTEEDLGTPVVITSPAPGQEIRFDEHGRITSPQNIVFTDSEQSFQRTVVITGGGLARLD